MFWVTAIQLLTGIRYHLASIIPILVPPYTALQVRLARSRKLSSQGVPYQHVGKLKTAYGRRLLFYNSCLYRLFQNNQQLIQGQFGDDICQEKSQQVQIELSADY